MKNIFLHSLSSRSLITYGIIITVCAAVLRAAVLYWYIAPGHYYMQPDSNDYHTSAMSIALTDSMTYLGTDRPIFWRTPGYPFFLAPWYQSYGISSYEVKKNYHAHIGALWVQVILSSLIPCILMYLAYLLTASAGISLLTGIIIALHPGFVLASTFLLAEGPSLLFFMIFLVFFFTMLLRRTVSPWLIIGGVLSLGVFTWMRPVGECVALMAALLLLCFGKGSWKKTATQSALWMLLFFATLTPWYMRNYRLTGEIFFCPTFGIYCNAFCAPKIVARIDGTTFEDAWKKCQRHAHEVITRRYINEGQKGISPTWIKDACVPIIMAHPFYFVWDWVVQVWKTTFDLYTYQLVAIDNNTYFSDPLIEYLGEKIYACTLSPQTPMHIRMLGIIELMCAVLMWIGLITGLYAHCIQHIVHRNWTALRSRESIIWISAALLSMFTVGLSGGFGYARLRLPIEPLLIILGMSGLASYIPKSRYRN